MSDQPMTESDAACQSCGIGNRTCFLEGGYCCIRCQDSGGMTHLALSNPPAGEGR